MPKDLRKIQYIFPVDFCLFLRLHKSSKFKLFDRSVHVMEQSQPAIEKGFLSPSSCRESVIQTGRSIFECFEKEMIGPFTDIDVDDEE